MECVSPFCRSHRERAEMLIRFCTSMSTTIFGHVLFQRVGLLIHCPMTVVCDRFFAIVVHTLIEGVDNVLGLLLEPALHEDEIIQLHVSRINVPPCKGNAVSVRTVVFPDMVPVPCLRSGASVHDNKADIPCIAELLHGVNQSRHYTVQKTYFERLCDTVLDFVKHFVGDLATVNLLMAGLADTDDVPDGIRSPPVAGHDVVVMGNIFTAERTFALLLVAEVVLVELFQMSTF